MAIGDTEQDSGGVGFGPGHWIGSIDSAVDWDQLLPLVAWTESVVGEPPLSHSPVTLLKTFLLQQWFGFTAAELDHELEDRLSLRRFIGLQMGERPPQIDELIRFRQALDKSGVVAELFTRLRQQLFASGVPESDKDPRSSGSDRNPFSLASDVRMFRPPGWVSKEKLFLDYWHLRHGGAGLPVYRQDEIQRAPEDIRANLVVIRTNGDDGTFRYEYCGEEVTRGNQASLTGTEIVQKARANTANYGHPGLQSEILAALRSAMKNAHPVGMATHFFNAAGNRCQYWAVFAPYRVAQAGPGQPANDDIVLVGTVMISRIEPLFAELSGGQQLMAEPDLAMLSKFARPPGPPDWAELETKFLDYWNQQRQGRKTPHLRDIKLSDIPDLQANLTLIRVLQPEIDFQYEYVGDQIELGNEGKIEGGIIGRRIERNIREYGYAGLQGDLQESFLGAVYGVAPTATSRHFVNASNHVRQLWSLQAPLSNDDGEVAMLIGVMLVKPISAN